VAEKLGSGYRVSAQDTVPFVLWCVAHHLEDYQDAFWTTVSGLGDMDTTCAIAGGIVALSARRSGIPAAWLESREPLPEGFLPK
jgi:ADP-ribosylglycohydrolase